MQVNVVTQNRSTAVNVEAKFPKKLKFLFEPHRYKVAWGGRGSAKSYSFALALLILGASNKLRILCTREIQKSIKDSVHKLLSDLIQEYQFGSFYQVLEQEIRGTNGTEFIFSGLQQHTVESIKSIQGVDICWVEEAQTVSKKSWDILIPTIRNENSEIWLSFNPELDSDDTYKRFVINTPNNCAITHINYNDNPWFPQVLEQERIHCLETSPEDYENIWEGKCRSAVIGAIYAKEVDQAIRDGRITNVPYNPMLKVHAIWDLGWNDSMAIIMCQRLRSEIMIIDTIKDDHKTLDYYVGELNKRNYNWGYDYIPHDGEHGDFKTGLSTQQILKRLGRRVKITPNIGLEEGIKIARMSFGQAVFDRVKAAQLVEDLKRYKRKVSRDGVDGAPHHDDSSHFADCFRYLCINAPELLNDYDQHTNTSFIQHKVTVPGFN